MANWFTRIIGSATNRIAEVTTASELQVLDSNSAAITTALQAIQTAVQLLDNAVSGSALNVKVTDGSNSLVINLDGTINVITADNTSTIISGTDSLTPKFAIISATASGNNTLVAAVSGKKIRVISGLLVATGAVNIRFEDGASGTALTGVMQLVANTGFAMPYVPVGHFETGDNTLLNLELSAAISVNGWLVYIEV